MDGIYLNALKKLLKPEYRLMANEDIFEFKTGYYVLDGPEKLVFLFSVDNCCNCDILKLLDSIPEDFIEKYFIPRKDWGIWAKNEEKKGVKKKVRVSNIMKPGCVLMKNFYELDSAFVTTDDGSVKLEVVSLDHCEEDYAYIAREDADKLGVYRDDETITINLVPPDGNKDANEQKSRCIGSVKIPIEQFLEIANFNSGADVDESFVTVKLFV